MVITHTFSFKKNIYFIFYAFNELWSQKHIWGKCIEKYIALYLIQMKRKIRFWLAIPHRTITVATWVLKRKSKNPAIVEVSGNWFPSSILIMIECLFFLDVFQKLLMFYDWSCLILNYLESLMIWRNDCSAKLPKQLLCRDFIIC